MKVYLSACLSLLLYVPASAATDNNIPPALRDVGLDQKLNSRLPLDSTFRDESGRTVPLREYFRGRPVILAMVYYECPMLCTQILSGLVRSLRVLSLNPGRDFEVVAVSINPSETPALAAGKRRVYLDRYARPATENGWHFLTGEEAPIHAVASAVGFRYTYDSSTRQYAHASGIIIITPEGTVARYYYGIDYSPRDVRLGLVEASAGKVGNPVDQLLLFCYHYDPTSGKYGLAVMNSLRAAGVSTVIALACFIGLSLRRDRKMTEFLRTIR
jgi:protein SCO1/2